MVVSIIKMVILIKMVTIIKMVAIIDMVTIIKMVIIIMDVGGQTLQQPACPHPVMTGVISTISNHRRQGEGGSCLAGVLFSISCVFVFVFVFVFYLT